MTLLGKYQVNMVGRIGDQAKQTCVTVSVLYMGVSHLTGNKEPCHSVLCADAEGEVLELMIRTQTTLCKKLLSAEHHCSVGVCTFSKSVCVTCPNFSVCLELCHRFVLCMLCSSQYIHSHTYYGASPSVTSALSTFYATSTPKW